MKRNYQKEAIQILSNLSSEEALKFMYIIAKNNPSSLVKAHDSIKSYNSVQLKLEDKILKEKLRPYWDGKRVYHSNGDDVVSSSLKMNTIKECRFITGLGLKEAKEKVEELFSVS